jgi:hypothetical protein
MHDPIPYDHIAELISDAEPSRQSAVLHDAWREYAAKAARPYAWKTFAQYARQHLMDVGDCSLKRGREKLTPWQDSARASPRVLVLGAYAALRVRGGALEIEHGPHDDRRTIRIDIDAEVKPRAILFDSHGEFIDRRGDPLVRPIFDWSCIAGRPGASDYDDRKRARNEG